MEDGSHSYTKVMRVSASTEELLAIERIVARIFERITQVCRRRQRTAQMEELLTFVAWMQEIVRGAAALQNWAHS